MPLCLLLLLCSLGLARAVERPTVAVVASDMLQAPASPDSVLTDAAIEELVRQAMELGGIRQILKPDAKHVLLKPCIVVAERDSWRNVDPRAVRAVALVVHQLAPGARITVGEGPGAWMKEARPEVKHWELNIADGFETEGYRAALADPRLQDAQIEFVDLNFAEPRLVKVPGGGWARDEYWIAAPVLDADVAITLPRLKTHMPEHAGRERWWRRSATRHWSGLALSPKNPSWSSAIRIPSPPGARAGKPPRHRQNQRRPSSARPPALWAAASSPWG